MANTIYKAFLVTLEGLGFLLNVFTLFLFGRLGLKATDMWLGVAMASCDILLSGFIVIEFFVFLVKPDSFMAETNAVITMSAVLLFATLGSITCVGYLGLVRYLVICHKYQVNELRYWWWIYLGHMSIILTLMIVCATNGGFQPSAGNYAYPDFHAENVVALLVRVATSLTVFACLLVFNVSYVLICKHYIHHLNSLPGYQTRAEKQVLQVEKTKVLLKISLMLILYNITIVPFFIVDFTELVQGKQRSWIASTVSGLAVANIAFVNPAMLITMHCETGREIKKLFTKNRQVKHYPIAEELNSSIDLVTY